MTVFYLCNRKKPVPPDRVAGQKKTECDAWSQFIQKASELWCFWEIYDNKGYRCSLVKRLIMFVLSLNSTTALLHQLCVINLETKHRSS